MIMPIQPNIIVEDVLPGLRSAIESAFRDFEPEPIYYSPKELLHDMEDSYESKREQEREEKNQGQPAVTTKPARGKSNIYQSPSLNREHSALSVATPQTIAQMPMQQVPVNSGAGVQLNHLA